MAVIFLRRLAALVIAGSVTLAPAAQAGSHCRDETPAIARTHVDHDLPHHHGTNSHHGSLLPVTLKTCCVGATSVVTAPATLPAHPEVRAKYAGRVGHSLRALCGPPLTGRRVARIPKHLPGSPPARNLLHRVFLI